MTINQVKQAIDNASDVTAPPGPPDDRKLASKPRNDIGNGERLLARYGEDLIDVAEAGWHVFSGKRWELSIGQRGGPGAEVLRLAHATAKAIAEEAHTIAQEAPDDPGDSEDLTPSAIEQRMTRKRVLARADSHYKFGIATGNQGKIEGMLKTASPYRRRRQDDLDRNPYLFNVENGTLDLSGGDVKLRPHDRKDLISQISPVAYDPQASCPLFHKFLNRVQPDTHQQKCLQVWAGYNLSGLTSEQVLMIHYGLGANGKGAMLSAWNYCFGDYAATVSIETFMQQKNGRGGSEATPDLARLPGKRLAIASEPDAGARLAESLVKVATGGGKMTARRLFEGQFEFDPIFKLNIDTNVRPGIRGQDEGIWRRVLLVPWLIRIPKEERDRNLPKKLEAEAPGILNWMLDGWRLYCESGLYVPASVLSATDEYRAESDPIRQFVAARMQPAEGARVAASRVYDAYTAWSRNNALEPISGNAFGRAMTTAGIRREVIGITYYVDHELIPEELPEQSKPAADYSSKDGEPPA